MLKTLFSFLLLFSITTYSSEILVDGSTDEIDNFLDESPTIEHDQFFIDINKVGEHYDKGNDNYVPLPPPKEKINLEKTPKKYKAILKKGSVLTHVKQQVDKYTSKDIYVIARQKYQGGQYSYVYDKKGQIKYKTLTKNLYSVESDIVIRPPIDASIVYPKKTTTNTVDTGLELDNSLFFGLAAFGSPEFVKTVGLESNSAIGTSFEARTMVNTKLPVHFGIDLQYLNGNARNSNAELIASWNALYFGPVVQYTFHKTDQWTFNTYLGAKKSLFFNMSAAENTFNFSSTAWNLKFEFERDMGFGSFITGIGYFSEKTSLNAQSGSNINISSNKASTNGFIFSVGYNFEITL